MIVPQLGKIIAVPAKGTEAGKRVSRSAVSAGFGVVVGIGFPKGWMGTEKDPGPVNAPEVAIALEANNIIARRPGGTSSYPSVVFMKTGSEDTVDGKAAKAALIEAVTLMINANPAIGVSAKSAAIMEECDKRWIVMTTAQLNALKANPYGTIYSAIAARKLLH
jgi:hypothetical protein